MINSSNGVRWKEPAILIGVLSLVIALLAFGRDLFGIELFTQPQATPSPATTSNLPASTHSPTPDDPSPEPTDTTPSGSPLADHTPKVGGNWIRPADTRATLSMACAANTDGDMYRAVQYAIPRRYAGFQVRVAPSDAIDDVQLDIRVDNVIRATTTLRPDQAYTEMSTTITGGTTLELRLTCGKPGGKVILSNAMLTN